MKEIDRRRLLGGILCGAVAAAGLALTSAPSEAMPLDARVAGSLDGMVQKAQVVVVNPRRPLPRRPAPLALLVASRSTRLWLALTPDAGSDPRYLAVPPLSPACSHVMGDNDAMAA